MEFHYALKGIAVDEFIEQLEDIWHELMSKKDARNWAEKQGIPIDQMGFLKRTEAISVHRAEEVAGLDGGTTQIIVAFVAPVVTGVLLSLWDKVILPKMKKKFGDGTIIPHGENPNQKD